MLTPRTVTVNIGADQSLPRGWRYGTRWACPGSKGWWLLPSPRSRLAGWTVLGIVTRNCKSLPWAAIIAQAEEQAQAQDTEAALLPADEDWGW